VVAHCIYHYNDLSTTTMFVNPLERELSLLQIFNFVMFLKIV